MRQMIVYYTHTHLAGHSENTLLAEYLQARDLLGSKRHFPHFTTSEIEIGLTAGVVRALIPGAFLSWRLIDTDAASLRA